MSRSPEKLRYAKTHEWVDLSDGVATIGISAFAVEALTDLVFIELPAVGKTVSGGVPFGEIESVKAVSDLYSPVTGEVVAVNSKLADRLETLSTDPYEAGWMIQVKVSNPAEVEGLLTYEEYQKQCAEEH